MIQRYKKKISFLISILLILIIPVFICLFSFNIFIYDTGWYEEKFTKYKVYESLDEYSIQEINNINSNLLLYLKGEKKHISSDFFNEREINHMKDVKSLISFLSYLFYFLTGTIILCFLFLFFQSKDKLTFLKKTGFILFFSGALTFFYGFLLWIISVFNFNFLFDFIHKSFFQEGTYVFNPVFEKIVLLYPQQIFNDIALRIFIFSLIVSFILFIAGLIFNLKFSERKKIPEVD